MKIVKKIFILSTSAVLGLSFCAGTAFASKVSTDDSKIVEKTSISARSNGKLRRSPTMNFSHRGIRLENNLSIDDFVRSNSNSRSPFVYDDVGEIWHFNLYSSIMESINTGRGL